MTAQTLLGIDTGGTFTDFVVIHDNQLRVHKVPSTPDDPSRAILQGIEDLGLTETMAAGRLRIIHGSTVATNAVLEGKLARTLYVANRGFEDVLELGRQARQELYALQPAATPPLVPIEMRYGTGGRLTPDGELLEALTTTDLDALVAYAAASGADAVAVNLLYSFVDPTCEERIEAALVSPRVAGLKSEYEPTIAGQREDLFVSRSSFVLPEYCEYERGIATYLNAALGPKIASYLNKLRNAVGSSNLTVMMSSGGTIAAAQAARRAVTLLLSGPAGGLVAAAQLGDQLHQPRLLTFDMGGTSTDVALIDGSGLRLSQEARIGAWPIAIATTDIHTIGAGGGSIAYIDEGGLLQVGPESAGAAPGPACYGTGGTQATVTDANLVLGRLQADEFLAGGMRLSLAAAMSSIAPLANRLGVPITEAALGIVRVANEYMAQALRVISVERGEDPRDFSLCCFGGAGGLHVCAVADALDMSRIVLPPHGAVFSALGMIQARPARNLSRSVRVPLKAAAQTLSRMLAELDVDARAELAGDGWPVEDIATDCTLDLRYRGQSYWLNLPFAAGEEMTQLSERFHAAHRARYGHRIDADIELVNLRVTAQGPVPQALNLAPTKVLNLNSDSATPRHGAKRGTGMHRLFERDALVPGEAIAGVALITEPYTTTLVEAGWQAMLDAYGCLHLQRIT